MQIKKHLSWIISLLCVIILVGIDQLTKQLANHYLSINGDSVIFIKYVLSFKLAYNTGAAFSILTGKKFFLVSISLIASIILTVVLCKIANLKNKKTLTSALILICAGTIGNLIDRAFFKDGVIDFLNFEFMEFPIFNFADSCLTIGAVLLVIYIIFLFDDKKLKKAENLIEEETEDDVEN